MKTKQKRSFTINREGVLEIILVLCGALFLYSALDKFSHYQRFRVQVGKSPILTGMEDFIAWFIPSLELATSPSYWLLQLLYTYAVIYRLHRAA